MTRLLENTWNKIIWKLEDGGEGVSSWAEAVASFAITGDFPVQTDCVHSHVSGVMVWQQWSSSGLLILLYCEPSSGRSVSQHQLVVYMEACCYCSVAGSHVEVVRHDESCQV